MALVLTGAVCFASPCRGQSSVGAKLLANVPPTVSWQLWCPGCPPTTGTAAATAGLLTASGSLLAGPGNAFSLGWDVATPANPETRIWAGAGMTGQLSATSTTMDCTILVEGARDAAGHLRIDLSYAGDIPPSLSVDVRDDGSPEAMSTAPPAPGHTNYRHERRVPVTFGSGTLPVRLQLAANSWSPFACEIRVRFEPSAASALDLGSGCSANRVGWLHGSPTVMRDYFLAAQPGPTPGATSFVAQGHGALAFFFVSEHDKRLPIGTLAMGLGCDDLLEYVVFTDPGLSAGSGTWRLTVPPLPAGLRLFVQHASLDATTPVYAPQTRFGATNVVRFDT
jgi:hypothetical protein